MEENLNKITKNTFEFCDKEFKTFKQDIICTQDDLHKSLGDNSIGFIIFYLFAIIFVALLFQLSTKSFSNDKGKKNK